MSKNARELMRQWWDEQHSIARTPGKATEKKFASAEESVATYRAKGDFDRSATIDVAEKRMAVISELRNFVNTDAILSDYLELSTPQDKVATVPNNQEQAVWTTIASIAAMEPEYGTGLWTFSHLRSMRIQRLAETINTCRG